MTNSKELAGQWLGALTYGPEYGNLQGEQLHFRLFIDEVTDGEFAGKRFDLDGTGAVPALAVIKGAFKNDGIAFAKKYPHLFTMNENAVVEKYEAREAAVVHYFGWYDRRSKTFSGEWEIRMRIKMPRFDHEEVSTGTWEMRKDD